MNKIAILAVFIVILAAGFYFSINAWERWKQKMMWREKLKAATANEIEKIAKGWELANADKKAAAMDLVAESRGQKEPPGRFQLWLCRQLVR